MKKYVSYIFIFIFTLICISFLLSLFDLDAIWNYGFSYAISKGEIPYKDFNMILTPLYPFIMSTLLLISKNILVFYIENAILVTALFYFLFKMYKNKAWIFLILLVFPLPGVIQPSYNFLSIFLIVLLIYLEENKKNDYLIGIIIGLSILTKQSVGVFLILPTLIYYYKDIKKVLKRAAGCLIPCLVFLIFLLITNSLYNFIDLCFLGLLDFSNSNGFKLSSSLYIGIFLLIVSIIMFIRNRKNIKYFYILMFYSMVIPLFDFPHLEYFFFVLFLGIVDKIKKVPSNLSYNAILFSICYSITLFVCTYPREGSSIVYPNKYNNFNYRLMFNAYNTEKIRESVIKYINSNKDKKIIIIGNDAYFYKITCNMTIDHFDLNNYGNHGYNGTKKMKDKIDKLDKGTIIIVDSKNVDKEPGPRDQLNIEIAKYAIEKSSFIKKIGAYTVYEIK